TSQQIFGNERSTESIILLPQVLYRYVKILLSTTGLLFTSALLEVTATIFALILVISIRKKIPKEWFVFSLFTIFIPTLTGTLSSMPRYIIVVFPIYIALATIKSNVVKIILAIIFTSLLLILTGMFAQGYWVA
ncbi:MAG: hypothetical protein Q8P25_02815, partial [Candidatus Curtissbacteria bacterium]|nr:hypothetical protein [Candidatus Curtissbacteria bacterium]